MEVWLTSFWRTNIIQCCPAEEPAQLELILSTDAAEETPALAEWMNIGLNLIATEADVERVSDTALSDERVDEPMNTTPSEKKFRTYGNDADVMMRIGETGVEGLVVQEVDRMHEEHA